MSVRRSSNGFGSNPIGWGDMADFVRLSGVPLAPWEVEIIEMLDGLFLAEQGKALVKDGDKPDKQRDA